MILSSNLWNVAISLVNKLNRAGATHEGVDKLLRTLAIATAGNMAHRIHTMGEKADGSQIGTYDPEYMKVRTGKFTTNKKFSKGKNKGAVKSTGLFTKGKNKGSSRPNYHRTDDTKIVISLTRQTENDFGLKSNPDPIKTATGYGVGFKNPKNAEKAGWQEEKRPGIYKLSAKEQQSIKNIIADFTANAFQTR